MMKSILITGAAGFIGFHISQRLFSRGNKVVGLDNFNSYYSPALKNRRADLLKKIGIEIIHGDICEFSLLESILRKHAFTHIIHLAAQAGVRYSIDHPHLYLKSNIEGFLNILELCRQFPQTKLIYASSSSVYGLNKKVPFSIDDRTDQQASLYGVTKKSNELMAQTYHHLFGISSIGMRFFSVYGPWGRPDMAYYTFTKAILEETPIKLYNNGKMKRDFTYIEDVIDGLESALGLEFGCELFNLGNHHPVKLLEFIGILEKILGKKANIQFEPLQLGDVLETFAEIQRSEEKLGFAPKTSIEEGLTHFVKWYLEYHSDE